MAGALGSGGGREHEKLVEWVPITGTVWAGPGFDDVRSAVLIFNKKALTMRLKNKLTIFRVKNVFIFPSKN